MILSKMEALFTVCGCSDRQDMRAWGQRDPPPPSSNSSGGSGSGGSDSGEIYRSRMKVNDRVIVKPTSKLVPIGSRMEIKDTPGSTFKNMPDLDNEGGSYADEIEKEEKELRIMDFGA